MKVIGMGTHRNPVENIAMRQNLTRVRNCSWTRIGIGRPSRRISPTMLLTAEK